MRRVLARIARTAAGATIALAGGAAALFVYGWTLPDPPLTRAERVSVIVVDRDERLLRAYTTPDGRWRLPIEVADVDPRYLAMLQAYEDRRYGDHGGVDVRAVIRATGQLVLNGRAISGASTLTMQVARLLEGEHEKSAGGKVRQMLRALRLERRHSKADILRLYLRLAPFGGNLEGVRAASLAYFGKEPRRLSAAEAALLVALPQAPEARRPDRHSDAARRARDRVLDRAVAAGIVDRDEAERAKAERVPALRREFPRLAPHLADAETQRDAGILVHRTTLDRDVQAGLEPLARQHARTLGPRLSAAVLVVDHASGEILAHVGSADYLDESRLGAVDMTDAARSPGSTLKPIIYALAFEGGLAHPETLIDDRPVRYGTYSPRNFDLDFRGTVTIREALQQSLNIPAVKVLAGVGPQRLVGRFRRIGVAPVLPAKSEPTLAVALGGLGIRMRDLALVYATLARGGEAVALHHRREPMSIRAAADGRRRLVSALAAWYTADILKDAPAPTGAKSGRIAYKTGTSYGFRDAWAAGFDGRHTIVVWVGRADGTATPGLTGRNAAAPLLFDAFARIGETRAPFAAAPTGALLVHGPSLPAPLRRFKEPGEETVSGPYLDPPVQIAFPPDRAELEVEPGDGAVVLRAEGGQLPLVWMVDERPIPSDPARREVAWQPDGRGFARLTVIDATGRVDRVAVRVR